MKREKLAAIGLTKEQMNTVCDMHHIEMDSFKKELNTAQENLKKVNETIVMQKAIIAAAIKVLSDNSGMPF